MELTEMHVKVLRDIRRQRITLLSELCEPRRQRVIDLGMAEPALVDTVGNCLFITAQGEYELIRRGML